MKNLSEFSISNNKNKEGNINKKELTEVFPLSNIIPKKTIYKNRDFYIKEDIGKSYNNNFNQIENIATKKFEENDIIKDIKYNIQYLNIDKNNLSKVFSSSDITKYKQINKNNDINQNKELNKLDNSMTNIEKIINMKELPEVFGSSDIKIKHKISTSCQTEENVNDLPDVFGSFDINNYIQDKKIKENEVIDIKDINNLKQPKKTLDLAKEDIEKKDLNKDFISSSNININQNTTNEITLNNQRNVNNKDLTEIIGSSNFNNFNPTSIIDENKSIDMEDLPEVFGSNDINNFQKIPIALNTNIKGPENKYKELSQYTLGTKQNKLSRNKSYIRNFKGNLHANSNPFDYKQSNNLKNSYSFSCHSLKKKNNQSFGLPILNDLNNINQISNIQSSRPTYTTHIDINHKTENESIENNFNPYIQTIRNVKSYQNINIYPMGNIDLKSFNNDKSQRKNNSMSLCKSISNNNFNNLRIPIYSGTKFNTIYPITSFSTNNIFGYKNTTKRIFNQKNVWSMNNYTYNSPGNISTNIIKNI